MTTNEIDQVNDETRLKHGSNWELCSVNRVPKEEKTNELLPDSWDFNQIIINEQCDSL